MTLQITDDGILRQGIYVKADDTTELRNRLVNFAPEAFTELDRQEVLLSTGKEVLIFNGYRQNGFSSLPAPRDANKKGYYRCTTEERFIALVLRHAYVRQFQPVLPFSHIDNHALTDQGKTLQVGCVDVTWKAVKMLHDYAVEIGKYDEE